MKIAVRTGIAAATGVVGLSLVGFGAAAIAGDDKPAAKCDDTTPGWVQSVESDDDLDDDNDAAGTYSKASQHTCGHGRASAPSNASAPSRIVSRHETAQTRATAADGRARQSQRRQRSAAVSRTKLGSLSTRSYWLPSWSK